MKQNLWRVLGWCAVAGAFSACISRGDTNVNAPPKEDETAGAAGKKASPTAGASNNGASGENGEGGSGALPGEPGAGKASTAGKGSGTAGTEPEGDAGGGSVEPGACVAELAQLARIAAGSSHVCAISGDGVKCWGDNTFGQLGAGDVDPRALPVAVTELGGKVVGLTAGAEHTCALLESGKVQCWGNNPSGQLGTGDDSARYEATDVVGLTDAVAISGGYGHSCAVRASGAVQCWGLNEHAELGMGEVGAPVLQPNDVSNLKSAVSIASGNSHTCAVLADCTVKCWGYGDFGTIGNNGTGVAVVPSSVLEDGQPLTGIASVGTGQDHTCAIVKANGAVKCWGFNSSAQASPLGFQAVRQLTAVAIPGLSNVTEVTGARDFSCARRSNGTARCWGSQAYGLLGDGMPNNGLSGPVQVANLTTAENIASARTTEKYAFTCALLADASAVCWGQGEYGQLGNGSGADQATPLPVQNFP